MARILNISGTKITDYGIIKLIDYVADHLSDANMLVVGCSPYFSDVDAVLISSDKVYAIEVKNWKGDIVGKSYGKWIKDGKPIANPLYQARNNTVALAKWLREKTNNAKVWVNGLLVFVHDECTLDLSGLDDKSYKGVKIMRINEIDSVDANRNSDATDGLGDVKGVFLGLGEKERSMGKIIDDNSPLWMILVVLFTVIVFICLIINVSVWPAFIIMAFISFLVFYSHYKESNIQQETNSFDHVLFDDFGNAIPFEGALFDAHGEIITIGFNGLDNDDD